MNRERSNNLKSTNYDPLSSSSSSSNQNNDNETLGPNTHKLINSKEKLNFNQFSQIVTTSPKYVFLFP
jgi:hypothetical protein